METLTIKYNYNDITKTFSDNERRDFIDTIPEEHIRFMYDKDDRVLMGSVWGKGKVKYRYIPAEFIDIGKPIYLGWSISYDGIGNKDLPKDVKMTTYKEACKMFEKVEE